MTNFPPHNPDFPDVDPATGDERATDIESETVKARELLDRLMAEGAW